MKSVEPHGGPERQTEGTSSERESHFIPSPISQPARPLPGGRSTWEAGRLAHGMGGGQLASLIAGE